MRRSISIPQRQVIHNNTVGMYHIIRCSFHNLLYVMHHKTPVYPCLSWIGGGGLGPLGLATPLSPLLAVHKASCIISLYHNPVHFSTCISPPPNSSDINSSPLSGNL